MTIKRRVFFTAACILILGIVTGAVVYGSRKPFIDELHAIRQLFNQEQWRSIHFESVMGFAPGSKEDYDEIVAACKDAGFSDPIQPQDDNHPDGSKYFCAVAEQSISDTQRYQLVFRALADEKDFSKVYSIWIAAVPMEQTEHGFSNTGKEYIFPANSTPDEIRAAMAQYFESAAG
jgi:hypothetical protein